MKIHLTQKDQSSISLKKLESYYRKNLVAAEKKPFLLDHTRSAGPFLGVQPNHHIFDASSQIASVGTGFNASSLWGTAHHLECWTENNPYGTCHPIRLAFIDLLKSKLNWPHVHAHFCNSGAEANEIAQGACFNKRKSDQQTKLLAFKGSFHGRMMVALSATWNPSKRQAFEWPGKTSLFVDHPTLPDDQFDKPTFNKQWIELWEQANHKNFHRYIKPFHKKNDFHLKNEISILLEIRKHLNSHEVFAVSIEPMQCEGGYRFSSSRFHHALLSLCHAYQIPLIYDEVQTGFGFGGEFFWHRMFNLKNSQGQPIVPDAVVCAKKSQTGLVLTHDRIDSIEQYSIRSLIRGYYQAMFLTQNEDRIESLEKMVRPFLKKFVTKNKAVVHSPKLKGFSFSFDFYDADLLAHFIKIRFQNGLLFYPAGSHTARFCLNLAYTEKECIELFKRLQANLKQAFSGQQNEGLTPNIEFSTQHPNERKEIHIELIKAKTRPSVPSPTQQKKMCQSFFNLLCCRLPEKVKNDFSWKLLTPKNFKTHAKDIEKLQRSVYEPSRRTHLEVFKKAAQNKYGISLIITLKGKLIGMAVSIPLKEAIHERGVLRDPNLKDDQTLYALDTTVHPSMRGMGLGQLLKYGMTYLAALKGLKHINSRNRDHLARQMLAINHSLGAYTKEWIQGDYPDDNPHNDCFYNAIDLKWIKPDLNLSRGIECHLEKENLNVSYLSKNIMTVINKSCLSNFASEPYLKNLESFLNCLPVQLRHAYAASGMSECVDKICKALWLQRSPAMECITFQGSFFGHGSFMSRSLSGHQSPYFNITRLEQPTTRNWRVVLKKLESTLKRKKHLGVFIEPLQMKSMDVIPRPFLVELKKSCQKFKTPLVFHDTASLFHRFSQQGFCASAVKGIQPDIGFAYLGGQMAVVYLKKELWEDAPLMFISTWDGDEYSLASFTHAMKLKDENKNLIGKFERALKNCLEPYPIQEYHVKNGAGWFEAWLPEHLRLLFNRNEQNNRYLVCPSLQAMKRFIKTHG